MKIVLAQTVLPQDIVEELKNKAKQSSIKEAISVAVYHYLECKKDASEQNEN